jgi:hypothetical protein
MKPFSSSLARLIPGRGSVALPAVLALSLAGCAARAAQPNFPEASALPKKTTMPDPLVMLNGDRVSSKEQWYQKRRPELKALFQHYMYGQIPAPARLQTKVIGEYPDFLEGKATLKLISLETGPEKAPRIDLLLVIPNQRSAPAPVFLTMNFCGNQALTADPRVPLAHSWVGNNCGGSGNRATDASRGVHATNWPLAEIVGRGYALASFYSGDADPDRRDASLGVYEWLAHGDPGQNNPTNRGTLAAWAWGFHRCVDYLVSDPALDSHRIAALGHSRNGKTALLATAFDDRIAMAFPHQAGCGGSAPSRGKIGESVKAINDQFPHWFDGQFKQFNDDPEKLPFDQNCLVALCAPRPVLFSAAEGDQWANPAGQFEVLKAADPVYRFLGVEGLSAREMPPHGKLIDSRLGYYIRDGKHSMGAEDWPVFLDFADRHLKSITARSE